jgi:hypothetical protein
VNRWARRHAAALQRGLEPGEHVLAAERVIITAALDTMAPGAERARVGSTMLRGSAKRRVAQARALGFALPDGIFVLGITDRRVVVWKASPLLARPMSIATTIPLGKVGAVRAGRRLGSSRLALLLEDRAMLVVQPLWGFRVDHISRAFESQAGST